MSGDRHSAPLPFLLAGEWIGSSLPGQPEIGALDGVAQADRAHVERAVQAAREAFETGLPAHRRAAILDRTAELLGQAQDELADTVRREVDKPITLARGEVGRAIATFKFAAAEARTLAGRTIPMDAAAEGVGKLGFTERVGLGVIGAITPFNFPVNLVAHKLAPALAAGCPVVLKPAPQAPESALRLARLMLEAGLPSGWLSVLPGSVQSVATPLVEHPEVAVVTFTGSAQAGFEIARRAYRKKVLLELGGSAPAIVAADADLPSAAACLTPNAFNYAGQSCVSVQRIYAEAAVADQLTELMVAELDKLKVGDPSDPAVVVGPVIDEPTAKRLADSIARAMAGGASLKAGGNRRGRLLAPTILTDVAHDCDLIQMEAFGPVVSVNRVTSLAEAVSLANGTNFGLQAAVFTASLAHAIDVGRRLRFGSVLVNEAPTFRTDHMPYGGRGNSGNTKEGPAAAVREFTDERLVIVDLNRSVVTQ